MQTMVVVNPNSANSKTGRQWPAIEKRLEHAIGNFQVQLTKKTRDATHIVATALEEGATRIIVVGGDGTVNEAVNGFFHGSTPINPEATLGLIPRGTGGDLRKTLGIGRDLDECITVLAEENFRTMDVGLVSFIDHHGQEVTRCFANITSFGIGGLVDQLVNNSTKAFGGKASFIIGTLRALFSYTNKQIHLVVDDGFDEEIVANNVVVANGQFFGGGMWIAPEAKIDDGLFDVVILGDLSKLELVGLSKKIYKGAHLDHPKVKFLRGRRIEATCSEQALIDMDGEQPGRLPITLEVIPRVLKVYAPKGTESVSPNSPPETTESKSHGKK